MSATSSSPSNIALLIQPSPTTITTGGSHSKRLYTFVHYEHSTHPRRLIILFFVIIFVSLSFAWLIAGLLRLRQTASYLESCANGKVQCASGSHLVCSLSASLCLCPEQTFWDEKKWKCLVTQSVNQACSNHQQCDTSNGLICHTDRTCRCPPNTYYTITGCTTYLLYGTACLTSGAPSCNIQLGLICDTLSQTCVCPSLTYWSNARCEPVATYYGYCDQNSTCNTQVGLFCRLPGPSAACDCPLPSKLYTCDCTQGQTWVPAIGVNGTSTCMNRVTYSGNCTSDSQCPATLNLACIGGTCDCAIPLWFWSRTASKCLPCESQGYILIRYASQWVCTRLIDASLMTYSASRLACASLGWSLISPIFASDISVIAQAYPTYRLWVNMETSLGSSIYVNNIFPNNQSSWNTYVSSSFTADYSSYIYALQIVPSYDKTMFFEGNTNMNTGHGLCAFY